MLNSFTVYMHTCPNGKKYIGITSKSVEQRWRNGGGYRYHKYFYRAIKKYRWENIKHEILFCNMTEEDAKKKEKALIRQLQSNKAEHGYNQSAGGEGKAGWVTPQETKEKLRQIHLGKIVSQSTKEKLSISHKGKKLPYEQRSKISMSAKGKGTKCVVQMSKDCHIINIWDSLTDASTHLGISIGNISSACKGNRQYAGGYIWKYATDYNHRIEDLEREVG